MRLYFTRLLLAIFCFNLCLPTALAQEITAISAPNPWAMAIDPLTNRIYVADASNNASTVTIINGNDNSKLEVPTGKVSWRWR
jgi:DNA-binding beta-propeller fold protein YncE